MRKCTFNGSLALRRGDIVRITRTITGTEPIVVTVVENQTTGGRQVSHDEGVLMTRLPMNLEPPVSGRVISTSIGGNGVTSFEIEEGEYIDNVFVRPGEKQKGRDAIIQILRREPGGYVKIMDPYISGETIELLSNDPPGTQVLILTERVSDPSGLTMEAHNRGLRMIVRSSQALHDRFILTKGEGWHIGHSLKDFGSKVSYLSKMTASLEAESDFDDRWSHASEIIAT